MVDGAHKSIPWRGGQASGTGAKFFPEVQYLYCTSSSKCAVSDSQQFVSASSTPAPLSALHVIPMSSIQVMKFCLPLVASRHPLATSLLLVLTAPQDILAGSATWKTNPQSADWSTPANWRPATIPNGPGDVATFALTNKPSISLPASQRRARRPPLLSVQYQRRQRHFHQCRARLRGRCWERGHLVSRLARAPVLQL